MEQLLKMQNEQEGSDNLDGAQVQDAMGGVLSFLKTKISPEDFEKLKTSLPDAEQMITKAETDNATRAGPAEGGGASALMGSAMGMLGGGGGNAKPTGDGTAAPVDNMGQLMGHMGKAGVDPKQFMSFMPVVSDFLQKNAGVDVSSALGSGGAAGAGGSSGGNDAVGNLMNQAQGFMGGFGKK